ncbi:MAG: isopenicillin N synthase family dioxygenase [Blastocatellia bacterium]
MQTQHRAYIPIIDIAPLVHGTGDRASVAAAIGQACRDCGFFYITGHGVDEALQQRLERHSREFFAQDVATKMEIAMARGGRAWRGYFPVGGELTSEQPDLKEGVYFGAELAEDHPLVRNRTPLHGANLFPAATPGFRETVLEYIAAMTALGHAVMRGIAMSLGLDEAYFAERYTADPLVLFRIFNYPASESGSEWGNQWGVGEHTDYGLLTILKQDEAGGLQVKSAKPEGQWVEAPPVAGSFVCNIGDMLDRMTAGLYRSTPHRVRNRSGRDRLSFPFFFDPNFDAEVAPIPLDGVPTSDRPADDRNERWDRSSVHEFRGTYGDYLLGKVSKVFPQLRRDVL